MAVFKAGVFGAAQRLSASAFLVLGLLTFWVYSVWRFTATVRAHLERRWGETVSRSGLSSADPGQLAAMRIRGFAAGRTMPAAATGCFVVSALLVAWWFYKWILVSDVGQYAAVVTAVGVSSALFYAGTLLLMLWGLGVLRRHETTELLVREAGASALTIKQADLSDEMVGRWERETNAVVFFLVAALPMIFSPTLGAHLYLTSTVWGHELILPALCFALAAVFHVWGTMLLVGLYNRHLEEEARASGEAPANKPNTEVAARDETGPQRELVAIMMTDMHGYSKGMERNETQAYAKLVDHNRIMRGAIETHRGREIKTIGDAFLVIFRSALDAVDCAVAAQRGFADYNSGKAEDERIMVRIGIHLGDVLMTSNDVYGDGVNVAARIEPLATPGGICVSAPVFEMVRKKLQLDVQEVEGATLKNIASPPRLFRIRLAGS